MREVRVVHQCHTPPLLSLSLSLSKMKFLLELVTCYGSISRQSPPPPPSPPRQPPPADSRPWRRRERAAALRSKSAAEWRPSLCSISEDAVTPERDHRTLNDSERLSKRKVRSTTTARVHVRSYSCDLGRSGFPVIMPAFSPAPFFF
ncbi:hypothetical protein LOK49_LG06G00582 [Camellia lanceoleosa]|uniref:Uncharacterized protein n=1 Tax=Camellia lanceoleosa TaxID=1840588 RepID=A0ACC0HE50_9ERIC|nr:hypothetical protein LOK49_LG06G00582 [Camellia lanceoleosa]